MTLPLPPHLTQLFEPKHLGSARPPLILWHYTSVDGLMGIVSRKAVWATDHRYLNDPAEFSFARDLIAREARARLMRLRDSFDRQILLAAVDGLEQLDVTAYVTSFSENGNLLSQWRAYAPRDGFAVGFASSILRRVEDSRLVRCMYVDSEDTQSSGRKRLGSFLDRWAKFRLSRLPEVSDALRRRETHVLGLATKLSPKLLVRDLVGLALTVKHSAYAEEREWRLVSLPKPNPRLDASPRRFRRGAFGLTPYRELTVGPATGNERFVLKVFAGPTAHPAATVRAATELLEASGFSGADIQSCDIPYRAW